MYTETSDSTQRFVFEKEFARFLTRRIEKFGGFIKLHHITGHLSLVKPEVREAVGTSTADILSFIKKFSNIFNFKNDVVTLVKPIENIYDDESALPKRISNGIGVIIKLFPAYGFIKCKEPIKSSVYFSATQFFNYSHDEHTDLTDCGLNIGTMVNFNARKEKSNEFTSKYRATKVWKNSKVDLENNIYKPRKDRESGLYDALTLDGEGVIKKLFQNIGFIAANGDEKNTVFFYKNKVVNYDNIVDLTQVFKIGDFVEFSAHRTTKPDAKARWEATKVWNKSGRKVRKQKEENDTPSKSSSISSSNQFLSLSPSDCIPSQLITNYKQQNSTREIIHDQPGKICPRSNGAVIKFGENYTQLADGDSSTYYICGAHVTDISWEFSEGDVVKFDAVKIKSAPGWKAVLVWTGKKPNIVLSTTLGDFSAYSDEEIDELPTDRSSPVSSNYVSMSSRSSQKSVSMKSEFSDLKSITSYESTSNLQNSPIECGIDRDKRDFNHKSSNVRSMSPCSSQSNLSSSSESKFSNKSKDKLQSKKSNRKKINMNSKSPCSSLSNLSPSREAHFSYEENDMSNKNKPNKSKPIMNLKDTPQLENNIQIPSPSSIDYLDEQDEEFKSYSVHANNSKIQLSDKELTDSSEDSNKNNNLENLNISESTVVEVTNTASIKLFLDIVGEVTKVYSTFAEVKCSEIPTPVAFFCNLFYFDRSSMEDLDVGDLRKVLKVKDAVHVNYFEIVDDSGKLWPKVSLVWKGHKPDSKRVKEMVPYDFIQKNDLSVTLKDEPIDAQPVEQKKSVKKFLTAYDDISPEDKDDEHIPQTESCPETDDDDCNETFLQSICSENQEKLLADDIKVLSDMISLKMLKNKDLFLGSKTCSWLSANMSFLFYQSSSMQSKIMDSLVEKFTESTNTSDQMSLLSRDSTNIPPIQLN